MNSIAEFVSNVLKPRNSGMIRLRDAPLYVELKDAFRRRTPSLAEPKLGAISGPIVVFADELDVLVVSGGLPVCRKVADELIPRAERIPLEVREGERKAMIDPDDETRVGFGDRDQPLGDPFPGPILRQMIRLRVNSPWKVSGTRDENLQALEPACRRLRSRIVDTDMPVEPWRLTLVFRHRLGHPFRSILTTSEWC